MIIFILGVLSGFSLCCFICWVKIKDRDDEIDLLNRKIDKYESLYYYDDGFIKKVGSEDEDTN